VSLVGRTLADVRTALWALVSVMEALIMSGVTDPYEIYKYIHPSEVGTALGGYGWCAGYGCHVQG
jgi:3-oxoacyl-(acyl-carrier-protein) synthase